MKGSCRKCEFWKQFTNFENIPNTGECSEINAKLTVDIRYGWEGGYIQGYETEEDFGCSLFKVTSLTTKK